MNVVPNDGQLGMAWWNNCTKAERREWMARAGDTGVAADAWECFKAAQNAKEVERPTA